MRKLLATGIVAGAIVLSPVFALAETATSSNVNTMLQQIQTLQAQIKAMQDLQNQVKTAQQNIQTSLGLLRNLKQGMSGDDVKALQAILASDPKIYTGQITGFFGPQTALAVKRFQKKNGLEQVGNVGPKTLNKLNQEFGKLGLFFEIGTSTGTSTMFRRDDDREGKGRPNLCIKVPPGQQIPQGWVRHDDDDDDDRGEREDRKGKMILIPCQGQGFPGGIGSTTPPVPPQGTTTPPSTPPTFTMAQVSAHNTQSDCYSVVSGSVYNLTSWISQHPGGASAIIGMCGKDGTASFMSQHGGQGNPAQELALFKIGILVQ